MNGSMTGPVRTAQLLGALSLATDLADGFSLEKCLRTAIIATRLAGAASVAPEVRRLTFWASVLRFTGCLGFAHEEGRHFSAGDDISLRATLAYVDFGRPVDFVSRVVRGVAPGARVVDRVRSVARLLSTPDAPRDHARAQCEAARSFAEGAGMPEVGEVLRWREERWDGKGPRKLGGGDALPLPARLADVADVAELFSWKGAFEAGEAELKRRRGGALDPALVDLFLRHRAELTAGVFEGPVWDLFLESEPLPHRVASEAGEVSRLLDAFSRIADLASVYTLGHSRAVAGVAAQAAKVLGLPDRDQTLVGHAALTHDLGRLAVPVGVWEKPSALTPYERERVRTHSHHTEVVLRLAPALAEVADVASAAHERGGGAGYHRRLTASATPRLATLLAAADVYVALASDRPHRGRFERAALERELKVMVRAGELDAKSTAAVLEAAGHAKAAAVAPRGLTEREVEVVRLVAIGRTNKEIAALLGMSPRTAQKHVMNVYDKLGLESRAGLALFAVEHGLLDP